jgi:signal transduction histidine kinase
VNTESIAPTVCRRVLSACQYSAFVLFAIIAVCCSTPAQEANNSLPPPETNQPQIGHDYWGLKEGAPDSIEGLAQTSDGYLWLASPNGLVRFDGVRFERFRPPPGTELLSTNIAKVFGPPSGGLWIGYRLGGFSFLSNGQLTNYALDTPTGSVGEFAQDQHGIVWATTQSGIWKFEHSQWQRLGTDWNAPAAVDPTALAFDRDGILWVIAGNSLFYLPAGARQFAQAEADLSTAGFARTVGFTLDADGLVVTSKSWRPRGAPENGGPPAYPLLKADTRELVDRAGGLWVLSRSTSHLWPEGSLEDALSTATLQLEKQVTSDGVHLWKLVSGNSSRVENYDFNAYARLADREGNVWMGEAKGLHRFFYKPFVQVDLGSLFGTVGVGSDGRGGVWVGGQNSPLFHLHGGSEVTPHAKLERWTLNFVYSAPDGTVWVGAGWVGAGSSGLWHETLSEDRPSKDSASFRLRNTLFDYTGRDWVFTDLPPEVADQSMFLQAITQDRRGGLWLSLGRHGLYRYADRVWTPYGGRNDLPKTGVVSEFTDTVGRVWLGFTKNQLAVLDGDSLRVLGTDDGLRVGNVLAITGRGPDVWIGGDFGLQRFSNGRLLSINAVDNQMLHGISGIIERANGDLWLNGITGVFHISQAEVSRALQDPAYRVTGEHFGVREGLPGYAAQLRPLPSAIEATNGRLWFAVNNGVVWLDPDNAQHSVPALPVTIQSVIADDKYYDLRAPLRFPARTSTVEINYVSVSLSAPEAVRYRYKLQETDNDWREVRTAEPVTFRNLAPGSYHFVVASSNTNGAWSDKVAVLDFSIAPAFYQTTWFRLAMVATALLVVVGLYRLRLRQATTRLKVRFDERLAERTRIARELHDTLLQTVQGSKLVADDALERADDSVHLQSAMKRLSGWLGQATQEGRAALNSLRASTIETNDLVAALRRATEECVIDSSMAVKFSVTGVRKEMHPVARDEIYRIGYEAIRNACEHASASELGIALSYAQDLTLRVSDNGVGIEPAVVTEGRAGHFGLQGMRERAERIRSKLTIVSAPNSGTEMTLIVPGKVIFRKAHASRFERVRNLFGRGRGVSNSE